jgi:hypothetical protein
VRAEHEVIAMKEEERDPRRRTATLPRSDQESSRRYVIVSEYSCQLLEEDPAASDTRTVFSMQKSWSGGS